MGVDLSRSTPSSSSNVLDRIQGEAGGLGQGLASGLTGIIDGIADAIAGLAAPGTLMGRITHEMQFFRDGQQDLTDDVDLLSPLLDYGSAYVDPNNRVHGTGFAVFSEQLGPMRGCELLPGTQGGILLLDKGLWDIRVHLTADSHLRFFSNSPFRFELRVYDPRDGSIFSRQAFYGNDLDPVTGTIVSSVVVPEPNFRVRVYVTKMHANRGILGGPAWSRLAVQHLSRQVEGPWNSGSEASTPDPEDPDPEDPDTEDPDPED